MYQGRVLEDLKHRPSDFICVIKDLKKKHFRFLFISIPSQFIVEYSCFLEMQPQLEIKQQKRQQSLCIFMENVF